jgi:uncharacterized protein
MKSIIRTFFMGSALCLATTPAFADVKTGVDAWERGDYNAAVKEWRPIAIKGDADAQFNLAQAYRFGRGVPLDMKQAEDWYRKAAMQGHFQAEDNLGLIMFQNGDRQNAMPLIERSAGRGDARAQYVLGVSLFNGDFMKQDFPRAYALMTRASASGLPSASTSLAQMDKYIPVDQRQRGLAMARDMETQSRRPQIALTDQAPAAPISRSVPQPAPSVIRSEPLPPSRMSRPLAPGALPPPRRQVSPQRDVAAEPLPAETLPELPPTDAAPYPTDAYPATESEPVEVRPGATYPIERAPAPVRAPTRPPIIVRKPTAPPVATHATPVAGNWRVQLGAFGDQAKARALWQRLEGSVSPLSGLQPYLVKAGSVTRLQAGPLASRAAAEKLCRSVTAAGSACLMVAP